MTYFVIQKSQLEGAHRLDAEYYQPEYFIDFTKGKWQPIGEFLGICQYGISQAMNEVEIGHPIFRMDDIKNAFLVDDEIKYVDIPEAILNQYRLEFNDVLFNRVNSEEFVGRTGIFKIPRDFVFASYLIRLKLKNNANILPDYLNIFLNSAFGIKQIRKFRRRAVNQANVNAEELKQIKIAILPLTTQEEIKKLSDESWRQLKSSKSFYIQAENLLLEKLGLVEKIFEDELSYIADFSDVKSANRIDAEHFQPKYKKLIESFATKIETLGHIATRKTKKIKGLPEADYKYIEISNVNISSGEVLFSRIIGKDLPVNAKIAIDGGELVISKVRPTRGAVAIIPDNWNQNFVASGAFSVFEVKSPMREYLQVMLRSVVGKLQLEKPTTGTSYPTVTDKDMGKLIIPILPKPTQQKIADLVRQSHQARKKSKELLEEAKRKVEAMIEQGGINERN